MMVRLHKLFLFSSPLFFRDGDAHTHPQFLRKLAKPSCGDGVCQGNESCLSCSADCCPSGPNPTPPPVLTPAPGPSEGGVCAVTTTVCTVDDDCEFGTCTADGTTQCQNNGACSGGSNKCDKAGACQPAAADPTMSPSTFSPTQSSAPTSKKLKLVILAGQSNMQGHGCEAHLDHLVDVNGDSANLAEFGHLGTGFQDWYTCPNVDIVYYNERSADGIGWPSLSQPLTSIGFGADTSKMGPEVGIGWSLHEAFGNENILLIKIAWGGKSVAVNFRPPSANVTEIEATRYGFSGDSNSNFVHSMYYGDLSYFGESYRLMMGMIQNSLGKIDTIVPNYSTMYPDGYDIAGFVFHQGWNDLLQVETVSDYEHVLAKFIYSVRSDLELPKLPFVIGELGQHGESHIGQNYENRVEGMKRSQARVAECFTNATNLFNDQCTLGWNDIYEFYNDIPNAYKGNVKLAATAKFTTQLGADPCPTPESCGCAGYHYHNNAATMYRMGKSMGDALVQLLNTA